MRHNLHRHGAQYGNHLWSHPHAPDLSDDEFREQVGLVEELLLRTVGVKPKALRFPYGEFTPRQMEIAHQMGYYTVGWNKDYKDASKHSSIEHTRWVHVYRRSLDRNVMLPGPSLGPGWAATID